MRFRGHRSGFTLVEIALALGVVAFALVAIIGMLPVALESARESKLQTQAAFVARSIFNGLTVASGAQAMVLTSSSGGNSDFTAVPLPPDSEQIFHAAYDASGRFLGPAGSYEDGSGMPPSALFATRLSLRPRNDGLTDSILSVEAPAQARTENRKRYVFTSVLRP
jgi:Flp pilus assembly pilin Flp